MKQLSMGLENPRVRGFRRQGFRHHGNRDCMTVRIQSRRRRAQSRKQRGEMTVGAHAQQDGVEGSQVGQAALGHGRVGHRAGDRRHQPAQFDPGRAQQPGQGRMIGIGMRVRHPAFVGRQRHHVGTEYAARCQASIDRYRSAAAGQHEEPGFHPVPKIRIVTIEGALTLRDRAVELPARRDDAFRTAAKEQDSNAQGKLDL